MTRSLALCIALFSELALAQVTYQFGLLRIGTKRGEHTKEAIAELQKGHMAHINAMAESGELVGAGPLVDSPAIRGIFLFQATPDRAREMASQDPLVRAGALEFEFLNWSGPAGVSDEYKAWKAANPNGKLTMLRKQLCLVPAGIEIAKLLRDVPAEQVIASGPVTGHPKYGAVLVLDVGSVAAAKALLQPVAPAAEVYEWMFGEGTFPKRR